MLEPLCVVQQQRLCGIPTKLASQQQGISAGNSLGFRLKARLQYFRRCLGNIYCCSEALFLPLMCFSMVLCPSALVGTHAGQESPSLAFLS